MQNKIRLTFRIHFDTQWGDRLLICGNVAELGNGDESTSAAMHWEGGGFWRIAIDATPGETIRYKYLVAYKDGHTVLEFGERVLRTNDLKMDVLVKDTWLHHANAHNPFFSSAFVGSVFRRVEDERITQAKKFNVRLSIRAPRVPQHLQLCVSGSSKALGNWNPSKPLLLDSGDYPTWRCSFLAKEEELEYKYGLYDKKKKTIVQWEESTNRLLQITDQYNITYQNDEVLRIYNEWRGAGVAIPVFSIRTRESMGTGEFNDLKMLTDWSVNAGMKLVQILPINDTISTYTWKDSYPYNAISVNALHPIYVHVPALFKKTQKKILEEIKQKSALLNAFNHVNFEEVLKAKLHYVRIAFDKEKGTFKDKKAYQVFADQNENWLLPYAIYSVFRDKYKTSDFNYWQKDSVFNKQKFDKRLITNKGFAEEVDFYCYLQYHLDKQLREVVDYARSKGIIVKGDIPIGINRYGVEAWQEPHLFNFAQQAGAPPDDFAVNGQNWGFPTYNWDVMEREDYNWWKLRFKKMADFFDAYRIDHILGFFRIWEIPLEYSEGLMGHFNPALPISEDELRSYGIDFWYDRFCKPYISYNHIFEQFGTNAKAIIQTFFYEADGKLHFLEQFDSEEKLVKYFEALPDGSPLKALKDALRFYHYEVLLIPDEKPGYYHPRISMHFSRSYQHLPTHQQQALNNLYVMYYYHRHDEFWGHEGLKKLSKLVESTNMLVCGEDLGMVPHCVEGVMNELQILSLEVQRMPKDPKVKIGNPYQYPYLSVCTPATHDMSTIRGWWEEDRDVSQQFYNGFLQKWGDAPQFCEAWLNEEIVRHQLNGRSMLTVLSMQDWMNSDERTRNNQPPDEEQINIPANPRHYWKYRMHINLEDLMQMDHFNQRVKNLIQQSQRGEA